MMRAPLSLPIFAFLIGACDDSKSAGTLELRVYGESYIEDRIPAEAFADGWTIEFSTFLVAVSDVEVGAGSAPVLSSPGIHIFDLTQPSGGRGHLLTSAEVDGGRYDNTAFTIAPAASGALSGNTSNDQVASMIAKSASILVEGAATRGDTTKTFAWAFSTTTGYKACQSVADVDGGTHQTQLTIHADHLFYDSLVSEEPSLRFDLIAGADTDNDGVITWAELEAVDITGQADYGVGNRTDIESLAAFIEVQTQTLGHIDGEGHCQVD